MSMSDGPASERPSRARRAAMVLGSVVVTLVVLELIVRLFPEPDGFTTRVRAFSAVCVAEDPVLGHRLRPSTEVTVAGVSYRISNVGTRGPDPAPRVPGGPRRLLVLGDSVTMGWGVREDETFAHRLADALSARWGPTEVVNAGVLAYGTREEAAWLGEIGAKVAPDVVLVGYFPNDPESVESATHLPGPSWSRLWQIIGPRVVSLLVRLGLWPTAVEHHLALHQPGSQSWRRVEAGLGRIGRWCAEARVACGLFLLPDLTCPRPCPLDAALGRVARLAETRGLAVLDLSPAVEGLDLRSLWVDPGDAHPNAEGHARYAEALAKWLVSSARFESE